MGPRCEFSPGARVFPYLLLIYLILIDITLTHVSSIEALTIMRVDVKFKSVEHAHASNMNGQNNSGIQVNV